jgi:uncharacterized protein YkwD
MANPIALIAAAAAALLLLRKGGDSAVTEGEGVDEETSGGTPTDEKSATKQSHATGTLGKAAVSSSQPASSDVPNNAYCSDVANWPNDLRTLELEILNAINNLRATGANCNPGGPQSPAPALTMNPKLRCAARKHSKDMVVRGFFGHQNPSGQSSFDRVAAAGYNYQNASENLTAGPPTVQGAIQEWLNSTQGHCAAMFHPGVTEIGVGVYKGGQHGTYWTTNFAKPA